MSLRAHNAVSIEQALREYRFAETAFAAASRRLREVIARSERKVRDQAVYAGPAGQAIETIISISATFHGITVAQLIGKSRAFKFVLARHRAMALCNALTTATQEEIAKAFGGRGHTVIVHAHQSVHAQCTTSAKYAESYEALRKLCQTELGRTE